jgi:GDPmannose 4,6-dehydratase
MAKRALITGITGQDGSYLAELLLQKGYRIYGLVRPGAAGHTERIAHLLAELELIEGDLRDQDSLAEALRQSDPLEVYNLAAQSSVVGSWEQPDLTGEITALGAARILEAIRRVKPRVRFFQASSSEIFGTEQQTPQNERTPYRPRSPYAIAKLYAHCMTASYREMHGLYACCGILFNHESPRRGLEFVARKISDAAARIKLGLQRELRLGNLDVARDWGFAGDYVQAMWLMLQQSAPEDFVIATGVTHTVRELAQLAFECLGLDYRDHVVTDPVLWRPAEACVVCGDASRARALLGWRPTTSFQQMVRSMVESDLQRLQHESGGKIAAAERP